jgi:hypothetical protein
VGLETLVRYAKALEAIGALNFLDLDDILVMDEGEVVDPRSVIALPFENERPLLPKFERSPDDPFLRRLNASGKQVGHHRRHLESTLICLGCTSFSARFALQYDLCRPGNLLASPHHRNGYAHTFGQRDRPHEGEAGTS